MNRMQKAAACFPSFQFNATAWMLWLANILFAGDQIHYAYGTITAAPSTASFFTAIKASFAWCKGKTVTLGLRPI